MRKMSEELLMSKTAWLSTRCTLTWKVKDTKSKRLIFQLQPRVRGTEGNAFGSLPATQMLSTPTTFDANNIQKPRRKATGGQKPPLSQEVHMLPTPRASGQENPESLIKRKGLREAMQHNLTAAVQLMYPTPTKGMHKQDVNDNGEYARRIKSKGNQIMLPAHVKLYPTPTAQDHSRNTVPPSVGKTRGMDLSMRVVAEKKNAKATGARLSPSFVEFLMGFPPNWTKLEPVD